MRSTTWITILVGLFMFQSIWNVAAAFCVHEKGQISTQQKFHFGHHQNNLCLSDQSSHNHQTKQNEQNQQSAKLNLGEDHQDHLPSMSHLLLQKERLYLLPENIEVKVIPIFDWQNHYQPPDLLSKNPPPEFSLLMVG